VDLHNDESAKDMSTTSDIFALIVAQGRLLAFYASELDAELGNGDPQVIAAMQRRLGQTVGDINHWWTELERRLGSQAADVGASDEI
jgi:hypothetical protein